MNTNTKADKDRMISDNKRLIEHEASKYSSYVPLNVVLAEAYKIANRAAESYDPDSGAKFSTHLHNQLKKLSRISTQYGNIVRLPENKQFKLQRLNQMELHLKEDLNRDPNLQELSDALGMPIKEVNYLMQNRKYETNLSNLNYTPTFVEDTQNDEWLHLVYHDLSPTDKVIFEHKVGFGGKKRLTNEELAKKIKTSPSTVNHRSNFIANMIAKGWK
jgi:DNA-directed RNA polymerase sigma subunit (sigma70/sigma32)